MANFAAITILALRMAIVPDASYFISDAGQQGMFVYDSLDITSLDNTGTVIVNLKTKKRYKRVYDGPANVKWFGAMGLGNINDADNIPIQNAINSCNNILIPEGTYILAAPLIVPPTSEYEFKTIAGNGVGKTRLIKKDGTRWDKIERIAPERNGIKDTFGVDACFILDHENGQYTYNVTIRDLSLKGISTVNPNTYAIYAPRNTHFNLKDVIIYEYKCGYYTRNSWLANFSGLDIRMSSYFKDTKAFFYDDDGSHLGTGTTNLITNFLAVNYNYSIHAYGLGYSTFINCGADYITGTPYKWVSCRQITMINCGTEYCNLAGNHAAVVYSENSDVNINGFYGYHINGSADKNEDASALAILSNSNVTVSQSYFPNFINATSTTSNLIIQEGSYLNSTNLRLPENGNAFISYTAGSSWIKNSKEGIEMLGNSTILFARMSQQQINGLKDVKPGTTVFNSTSNILQTFNGSVWKNLW